MKERIAANSFKVTCAASSAAACGPIALSLASRQPAPRTPLRMAVPNCKGKKIAVVGSGISGLSTAWLLHRSGAKVTLYEAEATCGGHTLTDSTGQWPVDLGFQVYNLTTYPNLVGFLEELGVDTEPSDMSFSLSMDQGKLEWASHDLSTIFIQRKNIASPSFLRMVLDVIRFGREAPQVLDPELAHVYHDMTLGQYLDTKGYSEGFKYNYVLPMCAAVWSVPNATVLAFPVQMLVRFWVNHHLLDLVQRPCWRVVKGRSKSYVDKVLAELPDVRTGTSVASITRDNKKGTVTVLTAAGNKAVYDAVVLATHSDISLALLGGGATADERRVLSAIPYNDNDIYLHTDEALMPVNKGAWASWNFLGESGTSTDASSDAAVTVSYWLNRLQHLPPAAPQMFVTLNPPHPPAPEKTIRRLQLAHPVYSSASYAAQAQLPDIQGTGGVYFAGAWASYGFHEDGIKSGVAVAKLLGADVPWGAGISTSPKMGLGDMMWLAIFDRFARASIKIGKLRLILPNGEERHYGGDDASVAPPVATGEEWRGLPPRRATVRVLNMDMFRKLVSRTDVGLGEAYMAGDYLVDDLGAFMALMVANARELEGSKGLLGVVNWISEKLLNAAHLRRSNTREGSRKNIEEHYDAGNAMYMSFLDQSMTYSCGIHTEEQKGDLQAAQRAKLDAVIAAADIQPTDHVLEIGCGWGSFAMRAASTTGCRVTGLTLSKEQLAEATARVAAAGLSDKVTLLFCDYRDCPGLGTYDKVVSIEMIEAVGHEHLPSYFATINAALKPGGKAVIQVIAQPDERYESYCRGCDFIREHIFPGGHLPSMGAMVEAARGTQLSVVSVRDIGPDYAITLRAWRQAWREQRHHITAELGYSESWWLKYDFYFAYCEAAFDIRYIHDYHVAWRKGEQQEPSGLLSTHQPAAAGAVSTVVAAAEAGAGWVKQELPTDSVTQALLALYFFLAGLLVQRYPLLWIMPITSTLFALLHGTVALLARACSSSYRALGTLARAQFSGAVCRLVYSAAVAACALLLLAKAGPWMLLPQPSPLQDIVSEAAAGVAAALSKPWSAITAAVAVSNGAQAVLAAAVASAKPIQQAWASALSAVPQAVPEAVAPVLAAASTVMQRAAGHLPHQHHHDVLSGDDAWVLLPATLLCCVAAGYYAFRLWRLMRGRAAHSRGVALLSYTLLLLVYGVASFKGSQVALLAVALGCEAVGVPAAAGKVLDVLAAGRTAAAAGAVHTGPVARSASGVRTGLLLLERVLFPLFRVLPQVLLTVLVVLSSQSFGNVYYYGLAVAGMCLCHVLNVVKALHIYSSKPERVAAHTPYTAGVVAVADAGASSSKPAVSMSAAPQARRV